MTTTPEPQPEDNRPLVKGTRRSNVLVAIAQSNRFKGGKGNDVILGGTGSDLAKGGRGNDVIFGNGGDDLLIGGAGKDRLFGSADGSQTFDGGKGNDKIFLNGGTDTVILRAGNGTDKIYGFDLGNTSMGLSDGLSFDALSFKQGRGFSAIMNDHTTLAKVVGVSVDALNLESNFTTV